MEFELKVKDIQLKYENNLNQEDLDKCVFNTENMNREIIKEKKLINKGKVRDIFSSVSDEDILLIASDRISSFDRHLTTIPYKGIVLNKISTWWFNKTKGIVPNHILKVPHSRAMIVKKCNVFPIEFVVRAYLTGSTETSIWKNYEKGCRNYCGHKLPDDMIKNQKLSNIILTPTTKDEKDELISEKEILEKKIMKRDEWRICKEYALKLFKFGQELSEKNGLILVDTKYEFGKDKSGNILLVDELHTPDSSRYWFKNSYIERFNNRKEPESIDKEIVRKWVKENYKNPYDLDIEINIPDDLRLNLSSKYLQLHEIITSNTIN